MATRTAIRLTDDGQATLDKIIATLGTVTLMADSQERFHCDISNDACRIQWFRFDRHNAPDDGSAPATERWIENSITVTTMKLGVIGGMSQVQEILWSIADTRGEIDGGKKPDPRGMFASVKWTSNRRPVPVTTKN